MRLRFSELLPVCSVCMCQASPACATVVARLPHSRRFVLAAAPAFLAAAPAVPSAAAVSVPLPPTDFGLFPEGRPYTRYLDNAEKLVSHLQYYAASSDAALGPKLDEEITQFAAIYATRPGALEASDTPGLAELKAAYDALTYHFARYGSGTTTPLSEATASTVYRNAVAARKRIRRAHNTIGRWPNCNGRPLGSRDAYCSTQVL